MAKYNKELVEEFCKCIREGDTHKIACRKTGIGESTLYEWKQKKPEFVEEIKKARADFRDTITNKLEVTLWKRATGYEVEETETEWTSDKDGNPRIKMQKKKTKHIQPDTAALIFALTNVAPDRWVNRQKVETKEIKVEEDKTHDYCFDNIPKEELFALADKLQEGEHEEIKRKKGKV